MTHAVDCIISMPIPTWVQTRRCQKQLRVDGSRGAFIAFAMFECAVTSTHAPGWPWKRLLV